MNFSTKFRLLRAKSGLTQAEIADKLGITAALSVPGKAEGLSRA